MRNLIPVLMLVMSLLAIPFMLAKAGCSDSIHVLEKYRPFFKEALESVFAEKAVNFSYTATGNLIYKGDFKSSSAQESNLFKKLKHLMADRVVTNVIYEICFPIINDSGQKALIDTREYSGEGTFSIKFNPTFKQNYIVVDPDAKPKIEILTITDQYDTNWHSLPKGHINFIPESLTVNHVIDTWHGLGHIIYAGERLNNVVEFENWARKAYKIKNKRGAFIRSPMSPRPYDEQHNKMINYYDRKKGGLMITLPPPP